VNGAMNENADEAAAAVAALADYDLQPPVHLFALPDARGINNRIRGVRTGAGTLVWKTCLAHRDPTAIRYEHRLLAWLAAQTLSFATPYAMPTRVGETLLRTPNGAYWQALFTYLPGDHLDLNDPALIESFGAALAELHGALRRYPMDAVPGMAGYTALGQIHPAVPDPYALTRDELAEGADAGSDDVRGRWHALLDATRAFIDGPYHTLPRQVIHGDVGPSNAFAHGGHDRHIAAIFDFEFAMPDARAIDVASGLTHVMRLWERDDATALAMARCFARGYRRTGGLTTEETAALPQLMLLREVVGTIWWAGQNRAGTPQKSTGRIADMERLVAWLRRYAIEFAAATQ